MFSSNNSSSFIKFFKDLIIPDLLPMYLSLCSVCNCRKLTARPEKISAVRGVGSDLSLRQQGSKARKIPFLH